MTEPAKKPSKFPQTRWSLIFAAGQSNEESASQAMGELLQRYTPALKQYLLASRKVKAQDIEDVLQGFFLDKMISRWLLNKADRGRGRFRSLVVRSLENYCVTLHRRQTTIKRGSGQTTALPTDVTSIAAPAEAVDSFDVAWARQIVAEAIERFKADCVRSGREDLQLIMEERLLGPILHDLPAPSYESINAKCGFKSPKQAANALITAKARFAQALSSVVAEYVRDDQELEQEINELMEIMSRTHADQLDI